MTLWELHRKCRELTLSPANMADKSVKAIVICPDEPKRVIELDLVQILQDESGTIFQLKAKDDSKSTI